MAKITIPESEKTKAKKDREERIKNTESKNNPTNREILEYLKDRLDKLEEK